MATFKKAHSRSKPIVEGALVSNGVSYTDGKISYVASLFAPGGPPYTHYELHLSEAEMLSLVASWLIKLEDRLRIANT